MNAGNDTGFQTLEAIANANQFNRWMYDTIRPYCHGNILEVGSGIGNISSYFVQDNFHVTLSDVDDRYLQILRNRFGAAGIVNEILPLDLDNPNFKNQYKHLESFFDTVYLANVLEHIRDDQVAVGNCRHLLKKAGTLIILVPAYPWLSSHLDEKLGHYRRYTSKRLRDIFHENKFSIKKQFYFNAMGIIAWLYAKIFRLSVVPTKEMNVYDKIVPLAKFVDHVFLRKLGLSLIIIGEK